MLETEDTAHLDFCLCLPDKKRNGQHKTPNHFFSQKLKTKKAADEVREGGRAGGVVIVRSSAGVLRLERIVRYNVRTGHVA